METADKLGLVLRVALGLAGMSCALAVSGCGMPSAPLPPSLHLPNLVTNLAATRTGNQVALSWTMPRRDTDRVLLKGNISARVCRETGTEKISAAACETVANLSFAPDAEGTFTDTLSPALASGAPRSLSYFVELKNLKGRSAGLSHAAEVVAGEAPAAVAGLTAEVRKDGVVLRWTPSAAEAIRLNRKLVAAAGEKGPSGAKEHKAAPDILAAPPTPAEQNLLVEAGASTGRAIDRQIQLGETYEYKAQRVARVNVNGKTVELAGPFSAPLRVDAKETFLPDAPTGLAAVATLGQTPAGTSIDLSWQPNTEADVVGYAVYRRESGGAWQKISSALVVGPGYHDGTVQAGHAYEYAVTAIDEGGHESKQSATARETVPQP